MKNSSKKRKYLASIMDDSVIASDEVIDAEAKSHNKETKTVPTNLNEKSAICTYKFFYILLVLLLIIITLLIAVSIYCYLIKYWAK